VVLFTVNKTVRKDVWRYPELNAARVITLSQHQ